MPMNIHRPGQGYWTRLLTAVAAGVLVLAGVVWLWQKLELVQGQYVVFVRGGLAALIVGAFGYLIFRWVLVKPRSVDFLVATEDEMKKVNWPSRKEVIGSTWVVICCVAMLVTVLLLSDVAWQGLMRWAGVLE